jgi:hypothetical protein
VSRAGPRLAFSLAPDLPRMRSNRHPLGRLANELPVRESEVWAGAGPQHLHRHEAQPACGPKAFEVWGLSGRWEEALIRDISGDVR